MYINAITNDPEKLLKKIIKDIEDEKLATWGIVEDIEDNQFLTHTPDQWNSVVIIHPISENDHLHFKFTWFSNFDNPGIEKIGTIVGRFTERLMVNYNGYFTRLETFK